MEAVPSDDRVLLPSHIKWSPLVVVKMKSHVMGPAICRWCNRVQTTLHSLIGWPTQQRKVLSQQLDGNMLFCF